MTTLAYEEYPEVRTPAVKGTPQAAPGLTTGPGVVTPAQKDPYGYTPTGQAAPDLTPAPAAPAPPPMMFAMPGAAAPAGAPAAQGGGSPALDGWYAEYLKSNPTMTAPAAAKTTAWNVDGKQTVAGQLEGMLAKGSPLMTQAATRAQQQMNRRGLGSSSMAVGAGQSALYDAAMPIATQDASTHARSGEFNAGAENTASMFNTSEANKWGTSDLDRKASGVRAERELAQNESQFGRKLASEESMFGRELAEKGRATDVSAATSMNIAGMNYAMDDKRLTSADRQFMQTLGLERDKLATQKEQFAQSLGMTSRELDLKAQSLSQSDKQFYDSLKLDERKLDQQAEQFTTEWTNRFSLATMDQEGKLNLAQMDATNRKELANIEASYRTQIASEQNVANAWGTITTEIGRIQNNPDLEPAAKEAAIQNAINGFRSFANFSKKLGTGALDITDLLSFGITNAAALGGGNAATGGGAAVSGSGGVVDEASPGGGGGE